MTVEAIRHGALGKSQKPKAQW